MLQPRSGPFIRLFDGKFTIETVKAADIALSVTGEDGFELTGVSNMSQISRSPEAIVGATVGPGTTSIRMGSWSIWAPCSPQ